jgi:2-polyprenyl-6-methoxyphenol hydroxylase-like FAD-dependent oxidoreductase
MHEPPLPKVVVIGGSIAGLSTGIALRCLGCDVQIYEQSPTSLRGRGGGLVVQYEMLDWMASHGIATLATLSIPGVERQFLDRNGKVIQRFADSTPFTSWDAVFDQLRAAFPEERYHRGCECVRLSTADGRPVAEFASGERAEADLVIGADGGWFRRSPSSFSRRASHLCRLCRLARRLSRVLGPGRGGGDFGPAFHDVSGA